MKKDTNGQIEGVTRYSQGEGLKSTSIKKVLNLAFRTTVNPDWIFVKYF